MCVSAPPSVKWKWSHIACKAPHVPLANTLHHFGCSGWRTPAHCCLFTLKHVGQRPFFFCWKAIQKKNGNEFEKKKKKKKTITVFRLQHIPALILIQSSLSPNPLILKSQDNAFCTHCWVRFVPWERTHSHSKPSFLSRLAETTMLYSLDVSWLQHSTIVCQL